MHVSNYGLPSTSLCRIIKLIITFRMSSPARKKEKKDEEDAGLPPEGFIRFEVDKVSKLSEQVRYSSEVDVRGVPWRVGVVNDGEFSVLLYCMSTQCALWEIDVDIETTLVHPDSNNNLMEKMELCFFTAEDRYWFAYAQDWASFIEDAQGLIKDDKITIEVRFWITNMRGVRAAPRIDFTDPDEPRHDVALVIGGKKVYASKQVLSTHSSVFNTMFYGNFIERNKKEIDLKDVDGEEFLELLHVIYPSYKKITDESAEYLLKLGDKFQIAYVTDRAEEFLIGSDAFCISEKLQIADKFRLFGLQKHCLSKLNKIQDFKAIKESAQFNELSPETKDLLFERLLFTHK